MIYFTFLYGVLHAHSRSGPFIFMMKDGIFIFHYIIIIESEVAIIWGSVKYLWYTLHVLLYHYYIKITKEIDRLIILFATTSVEKVKLQ